MNETITIVRFIARNDSGEYGADTCDHCGADGRYQWRFVTEDGETRGAMAGCLDRVFYQTLIAKKQRYLLEKAEKYAQNGWSLPRADRDSQEAINAFYRGEIARSTAEARIRSNDFIAAKARKARYAS